MRGVSDSALLMLLGLLRHAIAHDAGPVTGWRDEPRELTVAGRARMRTAAAGIRKLGVRYDALLTSPLTRCVQTAAIVGAELGTAPAIDERLRPGLELPHLLAILVEHRDAEALLVCGHQPDLSLVTAELIGGGLVEFKKGALALIEVTGLHPGGGMLRALYPPSGLRAAGK